MRLRCLLVAALALVAPRVMRAQYPPLPIPHPVHNWLGVGAGAVFVGSAAQHASGTATALRGDVATQVAPHTVLEVDAMIFAQTFEQLEGCATSNGDLASGCGARLPIQPKDAIAASVGREVGIVHGTPKLVLGAAGGAYRLNGFGGWYFGIDAVATAVIVDFGRLALTATAQPMLLPNVTDDHLWIVPITFGIRAH